MRLKHIASGETSTIYAMSETNGSEIVQVKNWLEEHCPGEYAVDGVYIFVTPKYDTFFALNFSGVIF